MSKLDSLKEVGSRIRWRSIFAVLVVLAIVVLVFRSLPSGYAIKDNLGLKAYADPSTIRLGGKTMLEIEVKNLGQDKDVNVVVKASAYDEKFVFLNSSSTTVETVVKVGPKEIRRISYEMSLENPLQGTYGIEVSAKSENKIDGVREQVYVNVEQ